MTSIWHSIESTSVVLRIRSHNKQEREPTKHIRRLRLRRLSSDEMISLLAKYNMTTKYLITWRHRPCVSKMQVRSDVRLSRFIIIPPKDHLHSPEPACGTRDISGRCMSLIMNPKIPLADQHDMSRCLGVGGLAIGSSSTYFC
jgi:hypothetical protein